MELRPYQVRAVDDLRNAFRQGAKAPLLVLPTGGGKTVVFTEITRSAVQRDRSVLILVHRKELVRQTSNKLGWVGVEHGVIAAGHSQSQHAVQVASVQTIVRRLHKLDWTPSLIIIDEAHHAVAGSWRKVLDHFSEAFRLGVTATPCRLDGRGLSTCFDRLVHGPTVHDLIFLNHLSDFKVYAPPVIAELDGVRSRAGDYAVDQLAKAMDRPAVTGDAVEHYKKLASGQQAIVFCCNVKHADSVCRAFYAAGIGAATLLGETADRESIVEAFSSGRIRILVTVEVVSEGFDVPAASCAILLRPTKSLSLYLQQVGRVLRPAPGKDAAVILDHVGNVKQHGFPDDPRDWTLLDGYVKKNKGEAAETVRTCPSCYAAFKPADVCPICGHVFKKKAKRLEYKDGDLQELKRESIQQRIEEKKAKEKRNEEQAKAQTLQQLIELGISRGYSPGWAHKVYWGRRK